MSWIPRVIFLHNSFCFILVLLLSNYLSILKRNRVRERERESREGAEGERRIPNRFSWVRSPTQGLIPWPWDNDQPRVGHLTNWVTQMPHHSSSGYKYWSLNILRRQFYNKTKIQFRIQLRSLLSAASE